MEKDDLKWFGDGFGGFPKRLPEDYVQYTIYILDPKVTDSELQQRLRHVRLAANALTKKLLNNFVWQRDSFALELVYEDGMVRILEKLPSSKVLILTCGIGRTFLKGRTDHGDSVEDEWLIVYLLRELSREFPETWTQIVDTDGEFLLIEAANVLPHWLNPEIADNRVWLNSGQLLIIPLSQPTDRSGRGHAVPRALTLQDACTCIRGDRSRLLHSPVLEAEAFHRIQDHPSQISRSLHSALLTLPRRLAYVLHEKAAYVSPAVEAFYLRDPIAMRPLQSQSTEKLAFPPTDLVTVAVKFTKVGYAQLKSQQFPVPLTWAKIISSSHNQISRVRAEMGMKLTCGFEMLLSDTQNQDKKPPRQIKMLLEDINCGEKQLPTDSELADWPKQEDDDTWLDINFKDFEKELGRKRSGGMHQLQGGFGDQTAQKNLQKMVSRFEDFLNDETAGSEGAEYPDDMDNDNDDELPSSISSEGEDKKISFDEAQFASMMREMMGIPPEAEAGQDDDHAPKLRGDAKDPDVHQATSVQAESDEVNEIHRLTGAMEAELRAAGALQLDPHPHKGRERESSKLNSAESNALSGEASEEDEESQEDEEVNIDYNLAKNLLESFKSQAGMAGPSGNLMGLLGMQLPRDEEDDDNDGGVR